MKLYASNWESQFPTEVVSRPDPGTRTHFVVPMAVDELFWKHIRPLVGLDQLPWNHAVASWIRETISLYMNGNNSGFKQRIQRLERAAEELKSHPAFPRKEYLAKRLPGPDDDRAMVAFAVLYQIPVIG